MNVAHVHLLVNHLPIFGSFFLLPVLVLAGILPQQRALLGLATGFAVMTAVGAVAADQSGEGAEEVVETLPRASEGALELHEERAEVAVASAALTAAFAVGTAAWSLRRGETSRAAVGATFVAGAVTAGAMAWTGWAGGQITHDEVRAGSAAVHPGGDAGGREGEDDDD
jgi:hypothetical protein